MYNLAEGTARVLNCVPCIIVAPNTSIKIKIHNEKISQITLPSAVVHLFGRANALSGETIRCSAFKFTCQI